MQDHAAAAKVVKMCSDFKSPHADPRFDPGMALGEKFDERKPACSDRATRPWTPPRPAVGVRDAAHVLLD